jgi:hypothetical protein
LERVKGIEPSSSAWEAYEKANEINGGSNFLQGQNRCFGRKFELNGRLSGNDMDQVVATGSRSPVWTAGRNSTRSSVPSMNGRPSSTPRWKPKVLQQEEDDAAYERLRERLPASCCTATRIGCRVDTKGGIALVTFHFEH